MEAKLASDRRIGSMRYASMERWNSDENLVAMVSVERGKPTTFPLQNVVAGWTEGMQLVGQGGMIELWVPSRLGYGEQGSQGIPAHSTLHFIIELVSVN